MRTWLTDDPELLRATLAIVDAWSSGDDDSCIDDATTTASTPPTGEPDSTKTSDSDKSSGTEQEESPHDEARRSRRDDLRKKISPVSKPIAPKLSTNQRRHREIRSLHEQIQALEEQLIALQTKKQPLAEGAIDSVSQTSLWQDIAANQRRLQRQSKMRRCKLRKLVDAHVAIVQGLTKLIRQAQAIQDDDVVRSLNHERAPTRGQLYEPTNLADQFHRVELLYHRMDVVFGHHKFHDGSSRFVDMEIVNDLDREMILTFRETWTVPFAPPDVLDVLWAFTKQRYRVKWKAPASELLVDTANALVSRFAVQGTIDASAFQFHGQLVLKRFQEAASMPAIITNSKTDSNGPCQVAMHEHACTRVLPLSIDGSSPMARVQCSYHVSVTFSDEDCNGQATGRHHAAVLTNYVLDRLNHDIQDKQNAVETSLLHVAGRDIAC